MSITVNGKETQLPEDASINDLILSLGLTPRLLAVELNGRIVRRADWGSTRISEGDRVEIVHFVGGGERSDP